MIACVALALLAIAPEGSAAAPEHPRYQIGCDSATGGDPYVRVQTGTYGGGAWSENFATGVFKLAGNQYATSSGNASSVYDVWPWIHYGPGPPASATSCVVKASNTLTTLQFLFVGIRWSVNLTVNCSADGSSANASYALNLTGDMYDYNTGGYLVGKPHLDTLVATHSIACFGHGASSYVSGPLNRTRVVVSSGTARYTLLASDPYMYFPQPRLWVSATSTDGARATASVFAVHAAVVSAHCPAC